MKKLWEELLEEIDKLERYKNYLNNSEEKKDIYFNKVKIVKIKQEIKRKLNNLLLIME